MEAKASASASASAKESADLKSDAVVVPRRLEKDQELAAERTLLVDKSSKEALDKDGEIDMIKLVDLTYTRWAIEKRIILDFAKNRFPEKYVNDWIEMIRLDVFRAFLPVPTAKCVYTKYSVHDGPIKKIMRAVDAYVERSK